MPGADGDVRQVKPWVREVTGLRGDVNLQESVGPAGVSAVNSRCVAARLSVSATDDIAQISAKGVLRCCNCGLAVDESMKLPVRDPHDPIAPDGRDYVRIPLDFDELRGPSFEYSDYIACTPPCALSHMYDSPDFITSHVADIFPTMMWIRHRIDEPVNRAPPADCLNYLYRWTKLAPVITAGSTSDPAGLRADGRSSGSGMSTGGGTGIGLSAASFFWILANPGVLGYKQTAPMYIPPIEEEYLAVANRDWRFTQYYFQESSAGQTGPPQLGARLPPHLPSAGVKLDANPDVDHETDFAYDTVHPPHILAAHANAVHAPPSPAPQRHHVTARKPPAEKKSHG
jgi:hypothetical protein